MKNVSSIFILILVGVILFLNYKYNTTSDQLSISQHNLAVSQDSLRSIQLKNNEHVYTINSYILKKNELEKYLDVNNQTIKELEKKLKSKVAYISNIKSNIIYDSIVVKDTINMIDDMISYNIKYNDNWISLRGRSTIQDKIATTTIDTLSIPTPLQVGLTDNYQIWVKSKNPYLHITDIEGAVIQGSKLNQKQKKWGLGIQMGVGMQYGLMNKQIDFGPQIGIGINYKLF